MNNRNVLGNQMRDVFWEIVIGIALGLAGAWLIWHGVQWLEHVKP